MYALVQDDTQVMLYNSNNVRDSTYIVAEEFVPHSSIVCDLQN